jgi:hypothetical protein
MNKKIAISLFAVLFIAIAAIGTVAYFTKSFTSDNNVAKAASFTVDAVNAEGKTIGNAEFKLNEKLFPGMDTLEAYSFQINKNDTDVPVEYKVNLSPQGELFPQDNSSPIVMKLQRNIDGQWTDIDYSTAFKPVNDVESFKVLINWPHGENDIAFQGKTGDIKLEVVATQVDGDAGTEDPSDPEEPAGPVFSGNITFKATPNGSTRSTSNKEVSFQVNGNGEKVINVKMGDGNGTFESKVGDFTVTEEEVNGKTLYRVVTAHEYYASTTQVWRGSADTSVQGTVKFTGALGPYLSINSKELYDWFVKN